MGVLSHRDQAVLEHLRRYRISTPDVLQRLFCQTPDALKSAVRRLAPKHITSRPLGPGRRVYYQLTPATLRAFGDPDERAKPLGPDALARAFGVLHFCAMGKKVERPRLSRAELDKRFPALNGSFMTKTRHGDYYIDRRQEKERLGRLFVDLGGDSAAFVRKMRKFLRKGMELPPFVALLQQDNLMLTIVTYRESKRDRLRQALSREPLGPPVALAIVSELEEII